MTTGDTHKYELVDGERRWIVCGELGRSLWCLVRRDIVGAKDQYLQSFLANGGQESLTDYEIILALAQIKADRGLTNAGVAELIGKKRDWVQERLSLTNFGPDFVELMNPERPDGQRLPYTHARLLSRVPRKGRAKLIEIVLRDSLTPGKIRELVRKNSNLVSKGGYEFIKCMSLAKRIRDDAQALKDKIPNFRVMLANRTLEDALKLMGRVDAAMGDLALLRKALAPFVAVQKGDTRKISKSA